MKDARTAPALPLLAASGFAALGYQVAWAQQGALWLGQDSASVLAVVGAFFAGVALGAWGLARRVAASAHPGRWYAGCELVIAAWAVLLTACMDPASAAMLELAGVRASNSWQWLAAFGGTTLLLLPATAAMGATLPAMERAIAARASRGASIAALYAANTLGAVGGALATAFWLVPAFGLTRATLACAALSAGAGLVALRVFRDTAPVAANDAAPGRTRALALLAATGLLGIGYEVLAVRVLRQHAQNTVYTFALLLAVYLVGTTLGAAAYARWTPPPPKTRRATRVLLAALATATLGGMWVLAHAGSLGALAPGIAGEALMAAAAFLAPCVAMGALFSHLATSACARGASLGTVFAANTTGAALAPLVFGVVAMPLAGARGAMMALAAGYLLLAAWRAKPWAIGASASALALAAAFAPSLVAVERVPGDRIVRLEEGPTATVSVIEDVEGVRRLRIDNRQQEGSSATVFADGRQALLPLVLHPAPRRALFLGLGTGVTASVAAADPGLDVHAVELLPEVVRASAGFAQAVPEGRARLHVHVADARRFVRTATDRYDVIVSDNFHPARSGSAALYTVEHFAAVGARLAPGGIFCQWLPLHQMDLATLRSIVRAFLDAHPHAVAVLATNSLATPTLGLVALPGDGRLDPAAIADRIAQLPATPGALALDALTVLGSFVADAPSLARFAANAPANTDDRPIVAFMAPRATYAPESTPGERLAALLQRSSIDPSMLLAGDRRTEWATRMRDYAAARDVFLMAGVRAIPTGDARRMLAQVREPLLEALRRSPEFRPAYDPLLRIALAAGRDDPEASRAVLLELRRLQPARGDADAALRELGK